MKRVKKEIERERERAVKFVVGSKRLRFHFYDLFEQENKLNEI